MRPTKPGPAVAVAAVLAAAGLLLAACTDSADPDFAATGREAGTDGESAVDGHSAGGDVEADRSGMATGGSESEQSDGSGTEPTEPVDTDQTVVADPEIAEAPATEPSPDVGPDRDVSLADAPQADLGPGESVLCATVEIGLDAVADDATETMRTQRAKLVDGAASITDRDLRNLIGRVDGGGPLDEDLLRTALIRCEALGYRT